MAVFDIGLFEHFAIIFPFLLVWTVTFAVLSMTKRYGDNKNLNSIIALALAFLFILSKDAVAMLNFASPWFVIFFIFLIFIVLAFKIMGATDADIEGVMHTKQGQQVITWLIVLSVVIILISFSNVIGQRLLGEQFDENNETVVYEGGGVASEDHETSVVQTIFHPKVIGMVILLLIGAFTVKQLSIVPE